jgi:peptidyl serine alpha-galactosyltransferase
MGTVPLLAVGVEETANPLQSALEEMHRTASSASSVGARWRKPALQQQVLGSEPERHEAKDPGQAAAIAPPNLRAEETSRRVGDSDGAEAVASAETMDKSDIIPEADSQEEGDTFHLVFSTGCTPFQNWQSYVFFHRAMVVQQPGCVTRIASGCSPERQRDLRSFFEEHIATMASAASPGSFRIHFTPDYSNVKAGEHYPYFNKPFGVRHWMENVLGYRNDAAAASPRNGNEHDNTIVVLLDPDELLLRPFAKNDFSDGSWVRRSHQHRKNGVGAGDSQHDKPRWTRVEPGKPIGQLYAYGLQWKNKINMTLLVPPDGPTSPVDDMSDGEAMEGYVVGPPLLATASDLYKIVTQWTEFVPLVHDQYPHLLAEMVRSSLALDGWCASEIMEHVV